MQNSNEENLNNDEKNDSSQLDDNKPRLEPYDQPNAPDSLPVDAEDQQKPFDLKSWLMQDNEKSVPLFEVTINNHSSRHKLINLFEINRDDKDIEIEFFQSDYPRKLWSFKHNDFLNELTEKNISFNISKVVVESSLNCDMRKMEVFQKNKQTRNIKDRLYFNESKKNTYTEEIIANCNYDVNGNYFLEIEAPPISVLTLTFYNKPTAIFTIDEVNNYVEEIEKKYEGYTPPVTSAPKQKIKFGKRVWQWIKRALRFINVFRFLIYRYTVMSNPVRNTKFDAFSFNRPEIVVPEIKKWCFIWNKKKALEKAQNHKSDNSYLKQASPYQLVISNTSDEIKTVTFFGYNKYLKEDNFGNDEAVSIVPAQSNVNYTQVLCQSASNPFSTSLIRVQSTNTKQVQQPIMATAYHNLLNSCIQQHIDVDSNFSANQYQAGIIDIPIELVIDGDIDLKMNVLPQTSVTVTIFPSVKFNLSYAFKKYDKNLPKVFTSFDCLVMREGFTPNHLIPHFNFKKLKWHKKLLSIFTKKPVFKVTR